MSEDWGNSFFDEVKRREDAKHQSTANLMPLDTVMETTTARLDIQVYVDCPRCGRLLDLLDEDDTAGVAHNDEGHVLFQIMDVQCSECGHEFNVHGLEW